MAKWKWHGISNRTVEQLKGESRTQEQYRNNNNNNIHNSQREIVVVKERKRLASCLNDLHCMDSFLLIRFMIPRERKKQEALPSSCFDYFALLHLSYCSF